MAGRDIPAGPVASGGAAQVPAGIGPGQGGQPTLPSVDALLRLPDMQPLLDEYGHTRTVAVIRDLLAEARSAWRGQDIAAAGGASADRAQPSTAGGNLPATDEAWTARVEETLRRQLAPRLREVFNLTGTVLHTNLGRALLPDEVAQAVARAMTTPANLEFDLDSGGRGDRDDLVSGWLRELTGAEDATIVNNNAAGVLLMLNSLARGKQVVVSRVSWSRSAAPSASRTSCRALGPSWWRWVPPTAPIRPTMPAPSLRAPPCS